MLVCRKLRLNSLPPTPLSDCFDTPVYLCVCLKMPLGRACRRGIFFHHALEGKKKNVCEPCERYICWGVKYYFAIFPSPPHSLHLLLPLSRSFTLPLLQSVFLLYGSEKWSWWLTLQPVEHQRRKLQFWLNDFFLPFLSLMIFLSSFLSLSLSLTHTLSLFLSYFSFPESWCRCWSGIWMCPVEGNSVSPSSEPSKPWSTSSSSSSDRACSTPSKFLCLFIDRSL